MGLLSVAPYLIPPAVVYSGATEPQHRSQTRKPTKRPAVRKTDYSQFSHVTHLTTEKLACDSCHKFPTKNWKDVRKGDEAFPDVAEFPEHSSCLGCHQQQFFARERPAPAICSNCHVGVTPRETTRFLFPSLGNVGGVMDPKLKTQEFVSEFGVGFPHDKHVDVVGLDRRRFRPDAPTQFMGITWSVYRTQSDQLKSCPICHQTYQPQGKSSEEYVTKPPKEVGDNFWLKKGAFQTVPNSHAVCFTCHNTDSGIAPEPKDCQLCHNLLPAGQKLKVDFDRKHPAFIPVTDQTILDRASRRISSGAFRHEGGAHPDLTCTGCHNILTMNTLQPQTRKVAVKSCGGAEGCHITPTTDDGGALNFEVDQKKGDAAFVCTKCHITFGKEALPVGHVAAIPTATPK
ncbi:MAG TPA: cytochrome c3 family protein [Pyrinomonadaceae bacterium]|nr:cytochrome c3 family protein [Pyrinomonadaceae bacterium]